MMKILSRLLTGIFALMLMGAVGFVGWANVRAQEATKPAIEVLENNGIQREDGLLIFEPDAPTSKGFIYYPGGLVEPEAYAMTAQGVAEAGYLVVIPKMPLNLAFTDVDRAAEIKASFPKISSWSVGGHSLGGAMAAQYAKNNANKVDGLILFASYLEPSEDFVDFPVPILSIIGSNDPGSVEQRAFYEAISDSADLFIIEGGNHRQYAHYSFQADDGVASISPTEQQNQVVAATVQFLNGLE